MDSIYIYIYIQYSIPCLYIPLYSIISHEQFHELLVSPSEKSQILRSPKSHDTMTNVTNPIEHHWTVEEKRNFLRVLDQLDHVHGQASATLSKPKISTKARAVTVKAESTAFMEPSSSKFEAIHQSSTYDIEKNLGKVEHKTENLRTKFKTRMDFKYIPSGYLTVRHENYHVE